VRDVGHDACITNVSVRDGAAHGLWVLSPRGVCRGRGGGAARGTTATLELRRLSRPLRSTGWAVLGCGRVIPKFDGPGSSRAAVMVGLRGFMGHLLRLHSGLP
jgi:hypothetical protein